MPSHHPLRIVCISDTHNHNPKDGAFKLPKGDILIHAGDLTNQGTYGELQKTLDWIENADYQVKIVIADKPYYEAVSKGHQGPDRQEPDKCKALMRSYPSIIYLEHEAHDITIIHDEDGSSSTLKVFGSPWIPSCGPWAFSYTSDGSAEGSRGEETPRPEQLWERIPNDTDILVTHGPPKGYCDTNTSGLSGCPVLADTVASRVRPMLHVFGHVHEGHGSMKVRWDERGETGSSGTARRETTFVNPAIMAKSYPGPKRFNAPTVVELGVDDGLVDAA
ncbi:hypothetical protein KEM55_008604 [Ascosphaera atra]|nr:hypothetical protein KEM55_008604 [Ascosphaera atra]